VLDLAVAAIVLEKPSFKPIVPGQSSRDKTRYLHYNTISSVRISSPIFERMTILPTHIFDILNNIFRFHCF
jgi:hypothetical protein